MRAYGRYIGRPIYDDGPPKSARYRMNAEAKAEIDAALSDAERSIRENDSRLRMVEAMNEWLDVPEHRDLMLKLGDE